MAKYVPPSKRGNLPIGIQNQYESRRRILAKPLSPLPPSGPFSGRLSCNKKKKNTNINTNNDKFKSSTFWTHEIANQINWIPPTMDEIKSIVASKESKLPVVASLIHCPICSNPVDLKVARCDCGHYSCVKCDIGWNQCRHHPLLLVNAKALHRHGVVCTCPDDVLAQLST